MNVMPGNKRINREVSRKNLTTSMYSHEVGWQFDLYIAPGYRFGDKKLLYSRIGYSTAESVVTLFTNSADDGTKLFDRRVHGFLVGVGYRQPVIEKVYGFVEGSYTVYGVKLENTTLPASGALVANAGALDTTPSVSLGLGRTF